MPVNETEIDINSEEIQEIITAVPKWIIRWGTTLIFIVVAGIFLGSAIIQYPDVVKVGVKVNSINAPKSILTKQAGKLSGLLVKDGQKVYSGQYLAFLESTADYKDVMLTVSELKRLKDLIEKDKISDLQELPTSLNLGEIQGNYQVLHQDYLRFKSTFENGYYHKQIEYLERDLKTINNLRLQIIKQQRIQRQEYNNAEIEYVAYKRLYQQKIISRSEYTQQENRYLSAKYPLQQTESSLLSNSGEYNSKKRDLLEVQNTINVIKSDFIQSLNKYINEGAGWLQRYVLQASIDGTVNFAGIIQQNQNVTANQEIFIINPGASEFFGELHIPQYNMGKIKLDERTLVKLRSYPYEQYGFIRGRLTYISEVAYRDSIFLAKVSFEKFENKSPYHKIKLKNGMLGEAEIITEESSLLQRFFRSIIKLINS